MSEESVSLPIEESPRTGRAVSPWLLVAVFLLVAGAFLARMHFTKPRDEDLQDPDNATLAMQKLMVRVPRDQQMPILLDGLRSESPGKRFAAADAMGDHHTEDAAIALEGAYTDSFSQVRQRALEFLPAVDGDRGLRLLLTGLLDEDLWMRHAASTQLNALARTRKDVVDRRAVPMLMRALDDPDEAVRTMSASALAKVTGKPWRLRPRSSEDDKRKTIEKWSLWWDGVKDGWKVAPEYADPPAIRPTRTDPSPDFSLRDINGRPVSLTDQRGRITLLNFWGTWCGPCQVEIPELVKLDAAYRDRGLDIIGIALGERNGPEGLRKWCAEHGVRYRQCLSTEAVLEAFGDIHEVPVSVLIDRKGRIRYRWDGERDFTTFRAAVDRLLAEAN